MNTIHVASVVAVVLFAALVCAPSAVRALGGDSLETVSDDDLVQMIKSQNYLIVLFSKKNCPECDRYADQLVALRNDFQDTLQSEVVLAHQSQLAKLYSPTREPAVVFFRQGVPLLYDGPVNEDAIFERFEKNREPAVKELSDATFEHLTQASTGSTTGDWLVQFYTSNCIECQRLAAVWEGVGAALRNRLNVARINSKTAGQLTAQRFRISAPLEFVLIRQGRFYRYEAQKYDVKTFVAFAQEFYKNSKAERIQVPPSPFDDVVQQAVEYIRLASDVAARLHAEQPHVVQAAVGGVLALLLVMWLVRKCRRSTTAAEQKQTKKAK